VSNQSPKSLTDYIASLGGLLRNVRADVADVQVSMATSDSREVQPDGLFVAIPGAVRDGSEFVSEALGRGAVVVVTVRPLDLPEGVVNLVVDNAYHAAGRIAEVAYDYPAECLRLVGITGTNGKTTCAFLLQRMMQACGIRTGLVGTVEYDTGGDRRLADRTTPTPFDLQRLFAEMVANGCEAAVIEVSSHALDQRRVGTARFAGGLFTNLSGDHLDYHGTMDAYFSAKSAMFEECLADDAPSVINADDDYGRCLLERLRSHGRARVMGFGYSEDSAYRIVSAATDLSGGDLRLRFPDDSEHALHTALVGDFNAMNVAGTAGLALELGVSFEAVRAACAEFHGAPGRLERFDSPEGVRVFVDYAHTDDALQNVLSTIRALDPRHLIVVFGCGGDRDRSKRPRMAAVAAEWADRVIATSDNPRTEDPETILDEVMAGIPTDCGTCERITDRSQAISRALSVARPGDAVVIAGKGHEKYQEINGVKHHFDDREEVVRGLRLNGAVQC
jgi:UDP-N-acetylmuramoyl-L-alanyl-D-glutamate--2,6-diaminopimelate ligase